MKYAKEMEFISGEVKKAFRAYGTEDLKQIEQKSPFDLVTEVDRQIEAHLSEAIERAFPGDRIHGEEMSSSTAVSGRTWTIDPIDGTCNMAAGIKLYGTQCSMIEDGEIVLAYIYLPFFGEEVSAVKGEGCRLNGKQVFAKKDCPLNSAVISFGDYPHKVSSQIADWQHNAIRQLYGKVEKIRMFGAACLDFSFVATGRTAGTVVITDNLWDIAPGILLCEEAGAIVTDMRGVKYKLGSSGVIVGADENICGNLVSAFEHRGT
ncbi:MAG: inositol monophosphatase [Clostridia bacterium]|nr:inositol monophosphatase [Clostridia bacterium]